MRRAPKKRSRAEPIELEISQLAPTGEGVGHVEHDGERRAVFVARSAPGDRLAASVDFSRRPARVMSFELRTPSALRAAPPCAVAERCGGCDWMHLARDAQAAAHVEHVREALVGAECAFVPADRPLGYRTRARLHVVATGGRAKVGFFAGDSHATVEVDACVVLHPAIDRARASVAELLAGAAGDGEARLALGAFDARLPVLDLSWSRELPPQVYARAEAMVHERRLGGARIACGESARPAIIGDPSAWIAGADGAPLELGPGGFAQASEAMNDALARAVAESTNDGAAVLELYAGAGNFTVLIARRAAKLLSVELDAGACEASRRNLERRGLRATVRAADASAHELPRAYDTVVLDPPRAGAAGVARALVGATHVKRVVYVSCDSRTLGRDLATLAPAFAIERASAFEMFPHTSHCEAMVVLSRRRR